MESQKYVSPSDSHENSEESSFYYIAIKIFIILYNLWENLWENLWGSFPNTPNHKYRIAELRKKKQTNKCE